MTEKIAPLKRYIKQVKQRLSAGDSTEHSYRGDLQGLLEELIIDISVINEPKRQEFGAPDYVIKKNRVPIGYIEAKDIGTDLNKIEKSKQLRRYLKSLDNLILTNYLEFRFFRYGEKIKEIKIGTTSNGSLKSYPDTHSMFVDYIKEFCSFDGETIKSAEKLARVMAQKARIMEEVLREAIKTDYENDSLRDQYQAFKKILIHDLDEDTFADVYAQTITYGMFAARLHDPSLDTFSRYEAALLIPKTNPFLRNLFQYIAGFDLDDRIAWIVDALANVYRVTDVSALIKNLGDVIQHDPMIHFYETFLSEYDPKLRKKRGIWYTPQPVVNFIVRAIDDILKTEFNLHEGLADNSKTEIRVDVQGKKTKTEVHKVQILDPAVGTGTFLAEVVKLIYQKYRAQQGIWNDYVEKHLIPRLNGFELLMAPYAMAHLKLDLLLSETGYKPQKNQRLKVYLTNALEKHHPDTGTILAFATWLSQEANEANYIKRDTPVMVVLGNPPYSGHSANKGKWIENLLKDYKQEPGGGKLKEKNPKWLNDDYVKFIRYGQYFIETNKEGILAFINNHSFLDNPTFRGMRWHLLNTFDRIYIIDLHGNVKKREVCPDGSPDENVFDIQQGVSINIFIKNKKRKQKGKIGKVFHYDLYGNRDFKYDFLQDNVLDSIDFKEVKPESPLFFFTQIDLKVKNKYNSGFSVTELFPLNGTGIITKRDKLCICYTKDSCFNAVKDILEMQKNDFYQKYNLPQDVRDWKYEWAKKDIEDCGLNYSNIKVISYRPFDQRYIYYTGRSRGFVGWPVVRIMRHFLNGENVGLVIPRMLKEKVGAFISNTIIAHKLFSAYDTNSFFPLYLYQEGNPQLSLSKQPFRTPNLNMNIVNQIAKNLTLQFTSEKDNKKDTFAPIDILDYIYAVLHSPTYREKYKEFLKIDFPRIPYPKDTRNFWELVKLGGKLREIHLLESALLEKYITTYPEDGNNEVKKVRYDNGKVWINEKQYFGNVPKLAWEFNIGGYQPAQKWLKDRKGRVLGFDDVRHYQKIIVALVETDRVMEEIDRVIDI